MAKGDTGTDQGIIGDTTDATVVRPAQRVEDAERENARYVAEEGGMATVTIKAGGGDVTLYKFLNAEQRGPFSNAAYSLPNDGEPGEWMGPVGGELALCVNGYHYCQEGTLLEWLQAELYEVEIRGERLYDEETGKGCAREMRFLHRVEAWNARTQRLFACDCAEHVLHLYERNYPDDDRPRKAIEVARRYAEGEATRAELDAAWDAAGAAAWDAAGDAAGAAAWAAAWDAAWDAAGAAAGAAEREWQRGRLMEYLAGEEACDG